MPSDLVNDDKNECETIICKCVQILHETSSHKQNDLNSTTNSATFAIMVLKPYADRVRDALFHSTTMTLQWNTTHRPIMEEEDENKNTTITLPMKLHGMGDGSCMDDDCSKDDNDKNNMKWTLVPMPDVKGGRKARRGYHLLIVWNAKKSPGDLPAIARQQISWAARITHRITTIAPIQHPNYDAILSNNNQSKRQRSNDNDKDHSLLPLLDEITRTMMKELLSSKHTFETKQHKLRVDVTPKSWNEPICRSLQKSASVLLASREEKYNAHNSNYDDNENDPYAGPLELTRSISQANFVISIIIISIENMDIVFGISDRTNFWNHLNGKLNDHASSDVCMHPTDPNTGVDLLPLPSDVRIKPKNDDLNNISNPHVPVSRAYYKLQQVYEYILLDYKKYQYNETDASKSNLDSKSWYSRLISSGGSGVDIGAAPGGWSQILYDQMKMKNVLSIDPGVLAQRVAVFVKHVRADFTSAESIQQLAQNAPFSMVVCDASTDSNEILTNMVQTFQKVQTLQGNLFTLPCSLVVTLKLPYKTQQSLERNLKKVIELMPKQIHCIAKLVAASCIDRGQPRRLKKDIQIDFQILHLMANSESERTVLIMFDDN